MRLMQQIRDSVREARFPGFVQQFMDAFYADKGEVPQWIVDALAAVDITLQR